MKTREMGVERGKVHEIGGEVHDEKAFVHLKSPIKTPKSERSALSAYSLEYLGKYKKRERRKGGKREEEKQRVLKFPKTRALRHFRALFRVTAENHIEIEVRETKTLVHLTCHFVHFAGDAL